MRSAENLVPVAVIIPTYNRGLAVLSVLERIMQCDPKPAEIWVHIDSADGVLERELAASFPEVGVLTSTSRLGPGGGRHRCLLTCGCPYAASFDDDSYPVDTDYFAQIQSLFLRHDRAAILGAVIWHQNEPEISRTDKLVPTPYYVGCGHALRLAAYKQVRGYLPRPVAYGMEEIDLSFQLIAADWQIYDAGSLRVFHDTDRKHHDSAEVTAGTISNVGLAAFLHYPILGWSWAALQIANIIKDAIRRGRFRGIPLGIARIPFDCYRNRRYRNPVPIKTLMTFRRLRRAVLPR